MLYIYITSYTPLPIAKLTACWVANSNLRAISIHIYLYLLHPYISGLG